MLSLIRFTNGLSPSRKLLLTSLLFLLVTLPRFNRNNFIVERPLNDARYFKAYVEYFRGETPSDYIRPASNWRLLVPVLAAPLPFEPVTAINIINLACLAVSIVVLYRSMRLLNIHESLCWMGCWIFTCSFPTFYYTTIGYVDPGVMLFIALAIYFTLKQQFIPLLFTFILGALAKETIVIALPFTLIYTWYRSRTKAITRTLAIGLIYLAENYLLRKYAYITPGERNPVFWGLSWDAVIMNSKRLNSYLAPLLSFGIPGVLFLYTSYKAGLKSIISQPLLLATWALLAGVLAIFITTVIATYCDGRMIWHAYYALIIAGMWGWQRYNMPEAETIS
jgi:Gpi18-like mannosyltransferase